jgi:hypothetical protein
MVKAAAKLEKIGFNKFLGEDLPQAKSWWVPLPLPLVFQDISYM